MKLQQAKSLRGNITLPGDKSISHRAAIIAALAEGKSKITNYSNSDDCAATVSCLEKLGIVISRTETILEITGTGKCGFRKPDSSLDCRNSGTTMRLLAGLLAGQDFESVLVGDESLSRRPMKRIAEPLQIMGANVELIAGHAPVRVGGKHPLRAIDCNLEIPSAQVKSCVLLAAVNANGISTIRNPPTSDKIPSSRDHTERLLRFCGAGIEESFTKNDFGFSQEIRIDGASKLLANDIEIPGDFSSAVFFIVAASILEDSDLTILNVGLNPTRTEILNILQNAGARIEITNVKEISGEPRGNLRVRTQMRVAPPAMPGVIRGETIARIIDEIPALAVFATQIPGGIEFRDAAELRTKESDRIKATVENLRAMKADVAEFEDGFRVGESKLRGASLKSFGDHRIAMAFAIAALFAEGESEIIGADCVSVSFPDFFGTLQSVLT
jgi:3-phosphoshikimate 1-carboxyvinyltransferase